MILVDTTVLVYAVGGEHPLRQPCRTIVSAVGDGSILATTTVEMIQEFAHVRARRRGRADSTAVARSYAKLFSPLLVLDETDLESGLELFGRHGSIGSFDAVVAAATIRRDGILVSAFHGFKVVEGLAMLNPAAPDLLHHLQQEG
ncbi:MAG: type II toxin-antitoxin system VapC family toxin [Pseudonocardiaceae bacterium]